MPEGGQLLIKNKIVREEVRNADFSDEKGNLRQKPNRELLGFIKFHLWAYQYGNKGFGIRKKQPWHRRLAEKVGEAPVLIDSNTIELSAARLSEYYFSKGYLNNRVTYEVTPRKYLKKRAIVSYIVDIEDFHRINTLKYLTNSDDLKLIMKNNSLDQYIRLGQRLDFERIEEERSRLTTLFRNNGYYYFNNSYIKFKVDTNQSPQRADLVVSINDKRDGASHLSQKVSRIRVLIGDTAGQNVVSLKGIEFVEGSYFIKPSALAKNIVFRPGEIYNASLVQKTYANLLSMGLFNFVTIRFLPSPHDSLRGLDVVIELRTAPKHEFIWEPQTILASRFDLVSDRDFRLFGDDISFGLANVLTLSNRNILGGAETFNLSSLTAIESQIAGANQGEFNSFRQSFNVELVIPSLVYFERKNFSEKYIKKNTKVNLSFLHDRNVNFTRNVFPFSYSYSFSRGSRTSFSITPFRISFNQSEIDEDFLKSLDPVSRDYTAQLLTDNLIAGPSASLTWNNRDINPRSFWQIRSNMLEISGNLASAYFSLFTDQIGINKEIGNVKYSQYARSDIDMVHTEIIDENNSFAYRTYVGAAFPYGNSRLLPFERRFFIGGGSNLRAWRARTIGPGSYSDSSSVVSVEKTGEFTLQGNLEYRFDIIDERLDGAIFFDAGNIWNFREEGNFENSDFKFNRFYKEIALNTGFGLRFDLTYVVFRTDWGIALRDPSKIESKRWVIRDFSSQGWIIDNTALNFAIGFPF